MPINKELIQSAPVISAIINTDNTGTLSIDAREEIFRGESHPELRSLLMARVIEEAGKRGRPVRVSTMDESGLTSLVVSPEGEVEEEESAPSEAVERPSMVTTQTARTPVSSAARTTSTTVQTPPSEIGRAHV